MVDKSVEDEQTIGEQAVTPAEEASNVRRVPAREGFDFAAFVAGTRAARRAVTVYMRSDLVAQRDILAGRTKALSGMPGDKAALERAQIADALDLIHADLVGSRVDVVVEGRSEEWVTLREKEAKQRGLKDLDLELYKIAGQIVEPAGATLESLRELTRVNEAILRQILVAVTAANFEPTKVDASF